MSDRPLSPQELEVVAELLQEAADVIDEELGDGYTDTMSMKIYAATLRRLVPNTEVKE